MSFIDHFKTYSPGVLQVGREILKVNNHLHTPYSFSAFDKPDEALDQAVNEGVSVVGVNDFYSFEAYAEWCDGAFERGLFPLFNVEFIGVNRADKESGLLINDPSNPGRIYISGKSLAYPSVLPAEFRHILDRILDLSNVRAANMTDKVNERFREMGFGYELNFETIKKELTLGQVRERHLARAIRLMAEKHYHSAERLSSFYLLLPINKGFAGMMHSAADMENEIRNALLKAGKPAFVEEDADAFADSELIREIIIKAGGIPTYPFLADAVKGYTDFERDKYKVAAELKKRGIWSVEFIPARNTVSVLKEYAGFLYKEGFVVTFGTEHNSPGKQAIEVMAKGGVALDEELLEINYEGACVLAAHQYLYAENRVGILDEHGIFKLDKRDEFFRLGNSLIKHVTSKKELHGVD